MGTDTNVAISKQVEAYMKQAFLVVGSVGCRGCTTYTRKDRTHEETGLQVVEQFETTKTIADKDEAEQLTVTRLKLLRKCYEIGVRLRDLGWLVGRDAEPEMRAVLAEIRATAAEYNATAKCTKLMPNFMVFDLTGNTTEIARALYAKIRDALDTVRNAIQSGDIVELRKTITGLKGVADVLPDEIGGSLNGFVAAAREAATAAKRAAKAANNDPTMTDDARAGAVVNALSAMNVDGVRAAFVEIEKNLYDESDMFSVDAKQIESAPVVETEGTEGSTKEDTKTEEKSEPQIPQMDVDKTGTVDDCGGTGNQINKAAAEDFAVTVQADAESASTEELEAAVEIVERVKAGTCGAGQKKLSNVELDGDPPFVEE